MWIPARSSKAAGGWKLLASNDDMLLVDASAGGHVANNDSLQVFQQKVW